MISSESASAAAIALTVLSACCVSLRFFTRIAIVKHVGPDDYLIALAWAASLALAVVTCRRTSNALRQLGMIMVADPFAPEQHDRSSGGEDEETGMTSLLRVRT